MTPLIRRLYPHYVLVVFLLLSLSSSFSFTLGQSPPPPPSPQPDSSVRLEYSGGHIAASYIIATLGSGTALQVSRRVTQVCANSRARVSSSDHSMVLSARFDGTMIRQITTIQQTMEHTIRLYLI